MLIMAIQLIIMITHRSINYLLRQLSLLGNMIKHKQIWRSWNKRLRFISSLRRNSHRIKKYKEKKKKEEKIGIIERKWHIIMMVCAILILYSLIRSHLKISITSNRLFLNLTKTRLMSSYHLIRLDNTTSQSQIEYLRLSKSKCNSKSQIAMGNSSSSCRSSNSLKVNNNSDINFSYVLQIIPYFLDPLISPIKLFLD